jgi:F0F1-type ATP synthase assembly protein I
MSKEEKADAGWRAFKYTTYGMEPLVFAIIGYFVGKEFGNEGLGAFLGLLVGIVLLHLEIIRLFRRIERRRKLKRA